MRRRRYETVPMGATWEFVAPDGSVGAVWLARRDDDAEMWWWSWACRDDSVPEGDWAPSYRKAMEECRTHFGGRCKIRFRRKEGLREVDQL